MQKWRENNPGLLLDRKQEISSMEYSQMKVDMFFETSSKTFEGLVELDIRQSAVYQVILAAIEVDGVR